MANAIAGVGTIFQRWDGTIWVSIAEINAIVGPSTKRDSIDATTFDTEEGYREFISGFKDGDVVALNMSFTRDTFELMVSDFLDDEYKYYQILFSDESIIAFEGFINKLPLELSADDKIKVNISIKVTGGLSGQSAIETALLKFLFLWIGDFSGDDLLNTISDDVITVIDNDFSTEYIPSISNSTFKVPNNNFYIDADIDCLWFEEDGTPRGVTVDELIGYDFSHTFVEYNNSSPYNINAIGILKAGEILTADEIDAVHDYFSLSIWWNDVLNLYGYLKGNRATGRSLWGISSSS